jgi:hypothetical protein
VSGRRARTRRTLAPWLALLLVLPLAACGGGEDADGEGPDDHESAAAADRERAAELEVWPAERSGPGTRPGDHREPAAPERDRPGPTDPAPGDSVAPDLPGGHEEVVPADPQSGGPPGATRIAGREVHHQEAGFRIFWPAGHGEVQEQDSGERTVYAAREFIYTIESGGRHGSGYSVRVMRHARGRGERAPDARRVVQHIEMTLKRFQVRTARQRPLEQGAVQGVEVQAIQPGGPGEVWMRGLLVGTDIYLLLAWDREGGVFEDPAAEAFFASFRLDG